MIALIPHYFSAACGGGSFLGFPTWYKYLPQSSHTAAGLCSPEITTLSDVWLIVAAVIEILLRVAALIAFAYVVYGGFSYMTSQGNSDQTARAKSTIISALVGLGISVLAAVVIGFIASSIT